MADKNNNRRNSHSSFTHVVEEVSKEIKKYRQILIRDPSSLVFAALAEAYRKKNLLDEAIEACKIGLRHHPDFPSGRVALARAYYDAGSIDKAQDELEKVVASIPDNLIAQKLLVTIYRERNDIDNLEKTLHRILSFDPHDETSKEALFSIEELRKGTPPIQEEKQDQKEIITKTLAEIHASQGYYEKAFDIYQKLLRRDPDNSFYHGRLADLKEKIFFRSCRSRDKREGSVNSLPETPEGTE